MRALLHHKCKAREKKHCKRFVDRSCRVLDCISSKYVGKAVVNFVLIPINSTQLLNSDHEKV